MLDEDHPPPKGEGTLCDQQRFQVLKGSWEIGFFEEAFRLLSPRRNRQLPPACQILANTADRCVEDSIAEQLRLRIDHGLPLLWMRIETIQKPRHGDVQSGFVSPQAVGD